MKLEELRERLRTGARVDPHANAPEHRERVTGGLSVPPNHQNCRSAIGPRADFIVIDDLIDETRKVDAAELHKWAKKAMRRTCPKCKRKFTPDPKLGLVPSTCAKCASYL